MAVQWTFSVFLFSVLVLTFSSESVRPSDCIYASSIDPELSLPWAVSIRPSPRATFAGAILNSRTILTTSGAFRSQTPGQTFQMLPFANYTVIVNGAQGAGADTGTGTTVQRLRVSYIKPHPRMLYPMQKWTTLANDFVLVYLAEPINFTTTQNPIGPVCLPNTTFMNQILRLDNTTRDTLSDVIVGGLTSTRSTVQSSYTLRLSPFQVCDRIWDSDPITKACACNYRNRGCGLISHPSGPGNACVLQGRDSGVVLPMPTPTPTSSQHFLLGFLNFYYQKNGKCPAGDHGGNEDASNSSTLVYVSMLMPDVLSWIENESRCGPDHFSCDNGTKCLELRHVCANGTRPTTCLDRSDQNSNYCDARIECEPETEFTCSIGLASYCIPAVHVSTGKSAELCDEEPDCPGGEDEDPVLCGKMVEPDPVIRPPPIAAAAGSAVAAVVLITAVITAVAIVGVRRRWSRLRELRDLTEEELIQFFEGERHLQDVHVNPSMTDTESPSSDHSESQADDTSTPSSSSPSTTNTDQSGNSERPQSTSSQSSGSEPERLLSELYTDIITRRGYDRNGVEFDATDPTQCVFGHELGRGAFGIVVKAIVHGVETAIKYPRLDIDTGSFKILLLELKILRYIHSAQQIYASTAEGGGMPHPNVVRFIGADVSQIRRRILYVALEYYENGNIQNYVGRRRAAFTQDICEPPAARQQWLEPLAGNPNYARVIAVAMSIRTRSKSYLHLVRWAAQIAAGMNFLAHKIRHLDLAVRNVMLDAQLVAKVGDFSLSRRAYENVNYKLKRNDVLPFRYLALELLQYGKCAPKSDVWSFGVALWELFSLCEVPWAFLGIGEAAADQLKTRLVNGERLPCPAYATPEIYQVMLACWNPNPEQRPDFNTLRTFFQSLL